MWPSLDAESIRREQRRTQQRQLRRAARYSTQEVTAENDADSMQTQPQSTGQEVSPVGAASSRSSARMSGIIRKWIESKGFGFIHCANEAKDVFVHQSSLLFDTAVLPRHCSIPVLFELAWCNHKQKYQAVNVTLCQENTTSAPALSSQETPMQRAENSEDPYDNHMEQSERNRLQMFLESLYARKDASDAARCPADYGLAISLSLFRGRICIEGKSREGLPEDRLT